MEPPYPAALSDRARRAYERGRLRAGLRLAALTLPMLVLSVVAHGDLVARAIVGATLFGAAFVFGWRGRAWSRGVVPGILAGSLPLVLPMLAHASDAGCAMAALSCSAWCLGACLAGGTLAGGILGYRAAHATGARAASLLSSGVVAVLTGSLGCLVIGTAGLVGLVVGFGVAALPVLAVTAARRA